MQQFKIENDPNSADFYRSNQHKEYSFSIKPRNSLATFKSIDSKLRLLLPKIRASSSLKKSKDLSRENVAYNIDPIGIRRLGYASSSNQSSTRASLIKNSIRSKLREFKFALLS